MSVEVQCPNPACGASQHVPEWALGQRARCRFCGRDFTVATATSPGGGPAAETIPDHSSAQQPPQPAAAVLPPPPPGRYALPPAATPVIPVALPVQPASPAIPASFSRFVIRSQIGAGATGVVYRAFDPLLGRDVAIKVPNEAALDNPQAAARFLREPRAAAQLRHPHIVPVYDAGTEQGRYYIASAYIEGRTLEHVLADGKPDFRRAAQTAVELADALHYAHALGIVHRDVKPANIMLDARGDALLMDFGLARIEASEKLTHDGTLLGTPAYMAPEQASVDRGEVGPASDQYSLGVVLYELLCGDRPFHGPPAVVLFHVINEPLRSIDPTVPRDLETIALKAMSKRPADRYADCRALADDLRRWLEDRPILARQMGHLERTVRWAKKRPAMAALAATVMLSAVVSTWFAAALERRGEALQVALADSQAHATRLQQANEAIRQRDADIEEREAALQAAEERFAKAQGALDAEQQQVAAMDQENKRIAGERDDAKSAKEAAEAAKKTAEDAAKAAALAKEQIANSDRSWGYYKTKLLEAQAALRKGDDEECLALLRLCPKEQRSHEWSILSARCRDRAISWSHGEDTPKSGRESIEFLPGGKVLCVHVSPLSGDLLKFFESATGREIRSMPGYAHAFHSDGNTIAAVSYKSERKTIVETTLAAGAGDKTLVALPNSVSWTGYDPDGAYLYFVEAESGGGSNNKWILRKIHRASGQLAEVTRFFRPMSMVPGKFAPDGRLFFLFNQKKRPNRRVSFINTIFNVEDGDEIDLPMSGSWESRVFSDDWTAIAGSDGVVLNLPRRVRAKLPMQPMRCPPMGSPLAFNPDGRRLACFNGAGVAIWNVASPDPARWERVIEFSDGVFGPRGPDEGDVKIVLSHDWTHAAHWMWAPKTVGTYKRSAKGGVFNDGVLSFAVESWPEPGFEEPDDANEAVVADKEEG